MWMPKVRARTVAGRITLQPEYSLDVTGAHNEFAWNEADVLNWNTDKPYGFWPRLPSRG